MLQTKLPAGLNTDILGRQPGTHWHPRQVLVLRPWSGVRFLLMPDESREAPASSPEIFTIRQFGDAYDVTEKNSFDIIAV